MATTTVTIMFTDLVGSTALMSRVGEAVADELRREHFEVLRGAIEIGSGVEVKNLGDGLMAVFPSAADALAASVQMQQDLWRRNRRADESLEIRVGIAAGDCVEEGGDYFGVPVVQAARLCAAAAAGEVLCTELIRLMAGSRAPTGFEPVGALQLKGLDEPVPTARVSWSPPSDVATGAPLVELPGRLTMAVAREFVGRDAEYDRLGSAWKSAVAGERQVVLLAGEPGIGKTTLSAKLATAVHDEGGLVAYGRSDEDLGVPYQPWAEALGHLIRSVPRRTLDEHVTDRGEHLARLVPGLVARSAATELDRDRDRDVDRVVLFGCVVDLIERVSAEAPVLLVLDDLHWADRQSLQLLRHVVTCGRPLRLLVTGTFRDSEVSSGDPLSELLAALHREQGIERIAMRGLTDVDVQGLLELLAGHELDERGLALRDALLEQTSGNPFFVREVLRHLTESGAIYRDGSGRWVGDADVREVGLPISVTEVVGRRLASLGDDVVRLLSLAAVIGRDFDVPLLAVASGVDEDVVVDRCDAAVAAAILAPTDAVDRYSFAHALIERTLYEGMSRSRRARAHRAVAEALERIVGDDLGPRAAELAYHWAEAVRPDDVNRALRYAQIAGDRALALLAPDEALRWYARALDLLGDGSDLRQRAELLIGLGDAQRQAGVADYRDTLLEAARLADAGGDVDLLVRAVLTNNRGMQSNTYGVDDDRIAMIDRALDRLGPEPSIERARLLGLACLERIFARPLDERLRLADEAVAIARACGDADVMAITFVFCSDGIFTPFTAERRRRWTEEAEPLAEAVVNPVTKYLLHNWIRFSAVEWGDVEAVRRSDRRAKEALALAPHATLQWNNAFHQVWPEMLWGGLAAAEQLAERAFDVGTANGEPDALNIFGAQLVAIRNWQGRIVEMIPLLQQLVESGADPAYRAALAYAEATSGDVAAARALLDAELEHGFQFPETYSWSSTCTLWADAAFRARHTASAATLIEAMRPHRVYYSSNACLMGLCFAHYLGQLEHVLGHLDDADVLYAEAVMAHERLGSAVLVAQTQVAWAALLADRHRNDDGEQAERLARAALATASAGGYSGVIRDAEAVLQQLGVGS